MMWEWLSTHAEEVGEIGLAIYIAGVILWIYAEMIFESHE